MANFRLKVETDVLRGTAQEVQILTTRLQENFDRLQANVKQTDRYWVGSAGDQYRRTFDAKKGETTEMLELLRKYPKDLLLMAGIYEETERSNTQNTSALPSDIL